MTSLSTMFAVIASLFTSSPAPIEQPIQKDFIVQKITLEDLSKVKAILQNSPDVARYTGMTSSDFDQVFSNETNLFLFLVCKDIKTGAVCGFLVGYMYEHDKHFYVRAIGVDKDYRRLGIATKLLSSAYKFVQGLKLDQMTIHASNNSAKKCYEKFGFKSGSNGLFLDVNKSVNL